MFKEVGLHNIDKEHICCAMTGKKNAFGVAQKKQWLKDRMKEGLKFIKLDVRGKVFIEYMPAKESWKPVEADGYLMIHCLWVSGKFQNQGHASELLKMCLEDSKTYKGVVVITGDSPFLTSKKIFLKHGFEVCDEQGEYQLLVYKHNKEADVPAFSKAVKKGVVASQSDVLIAYTNQCPFVETYSQEMKEVAEELGLSVEVNRIESAKEVRQYGSPFGTFNVYLKGEFLTHLIMAKKPFAKKMQKALKI